MQFNILSFADNAQGQLDSGISASIKTMAVKAGEGAEFPQAYDGAATSAGDINTLNSTGIGAKASIGDFIVNITDGSHAWIKTVNTDSVETTDLIGGTGNTFDDLDEWSINPFVITFNSRDGDGQITAYEKVLIIGRSTDTFTAQTRGYDGSNAQTWDADDYVDLFVVEKGFDGLNKAVSEQAQLIQDLNDDKADTSAVTALFNARNWKLSVRCATTGAGTLASDFEDGDTIDGITLATGDRILIKDQADATENGIYVVVASGAPTRATDFDTSAEITSAVTIVEVGTANADTIWQCTSDDPTIGADDIDFVNATVNSALFVLKATLTAKGSIFAASAASTPAELAVGTDGYAIVADSGESTGLNYKDLSMQASNGVSTRTFDAATGTTTIAHGLSEIPKEVIVNAAWYLGGFQSISWGSSNGSANSCLALYSSAFNGVNNKCLRVYESISGTAGQECNITLDATNITFNWTKIGSGTGATFPFQWSARA